MGRRQITHSCVSLTPRHPHLRQVNSGVSGFRGPCSGRFCAKFLMGRRQITHNGVLPNPPNTHDHKNAIIFSGLEKGFVVIAEFKQKRGKNANI